MVSLNVTKELGEVMIKISDKSKCVGCYACYSSCPLGCISMKEDGEGFRYPYVDKERCVNCRKCEAVCPVIKRPTLKGEGETCFAAYSRDAEIRYNSSSGGVFSVFAKAVLNCGGVVFGAAFDSEFQVYHIQISSLDELEKVRGSKYVQSRIEDAYIRAKECLVNGRLVYFSGTPCQIEGLNNYLGKRYDNLITQDFICHGVPAPFVWKKYIEDVKEKLQSGIKKVSFRDKTLGWRRYSLKIEGENDAYEMSSFLDNPMMRAYLRDVCLRPSCYVCPSKGVVRSSDITLADFWNVSDYIDHFDDNKGIDLIVCHSKKGRELLKDNLKDLVCYEVDIGAANNNISMNKSSRLPRNRDEFIDALNRINFSDAVEEYCTIPLSERVKTKIKIVLKNLSRLSRRK